MESPSHATIEATRHLHVLREAIKGLNPNDEMLETRNKCVRQSPRPRFVIRHSGFGFDSGFWFRHSDFRARGQGFILVSGFVIRVSANAAGYTSRPCDDRDAHCG